MDARDWLQGLVSNDVRRLARDHAVYAALLTPQGKYLFDFFLVEGADGAILLDVAASRAAALMQRLSLYRLRRDVQIADVSAQTQVALVWRAQPGQAPLAAPGALVVADPRDAALGWRLYAQDAAAALALAGAEVAPRDAYDALRVAVAAPESGVELIPDDSYILEAGFERLNGVDFRKGCYVGQEVTARMRHKTDLRKGLLRVRVEGAAPPPGTPVTTADGKPAGALFTVIDGAGLAHLRFDRAAGRLSAGGATVTAPEFGAPGP
ncbi:MAG: folate-binding protein YgfZ [Rhodobacterales bacterium CG18_big_fil_WC_8_21_14_2_50_71_9]|nr:MAG: folate-binding protein YgfZ [Rhodobacterales bacterium CG18_big_fil_WC_8_21_14_2_50_71_9]